MNIRVLDPADAESYREIRLESLLNHPEAFLSSYEAEAEMPMETTRTRLQPVAGSFTLGGFNEQGELMGVVTFVRENRDKLRHKGNVYAMYVKPGARKQRLGTLLMSELIARVRQIPGLELLNLTVFSNNHPAKRLYVSLKFTCYGTERNAVKQNGSYWDEDLMSLPLTTKP